MLKKTRKEILVWIGIFVLVILYALRNANGYIRASGFIIGFFLFPLIDYAFDLKFKNYHYIILVIILFNGILMSPLYFVYPNYDKILHFANPLLLSFLIYFLVDKLKVKFRVKILLTIVIVVAILGFFEMGEYLLDEAFDIKLQGVYLKDKEIVNKLNLVLSKNTDTMVDMMLGTLAVFLYSFIRIINFYYKKLILRKKVK